MLLTESKAKPYKSLNFWSSFRIQSFTFTTTDLPNSSSTISDKVRMLNIFTMCICISANLWTSIGQVPILFAITDMKVALIFLSVAVAITHQLFQRQRERLWWNYYPSADPFFNIYHRIYQNLQDDSIQPEYYLFQQPTRPITYPKVTEQLHNTPKDIWHIYPCRNIFCRRTNLIRIGRQKNFKIILRKMSIRMSNQGSKYPIYAFPSF